MDCGLRDVPDQVASPARDWLAWAATIGAVVGLYALLHNPWWVPGGDSEFYIVAARSLARGQGYRFNGLPVNMAPPGWPLVLAGAMKISPSFAFLKLVNLLFLAGFLAVAWWLVRRYATLTWTCTIVLVSAVISHVYPLSFWMHSDALFCLVSAGSLLVACQLADGRPAAWRLPLLLALCAGAVAVRWAGLLNWAVVAGILLTGRPLWPRADRAWVAVALTLLFTAGTFIGLRIGLRISPEDARQIALLLDESSPAAAEARGYDLLIGARAASRGLASELAGRGIACGKWLSWLFWQPLRLGAVHWLPDALAGLVGWALIALVLRWTWRAARQRQWMWLGLAALCSALCLNWPKVNARYLVPFAPLILLAVVLSLRSIGHRAGTVLLAAFLGSVILCNGVLYAIDVRVAHSADFYGTYEAGLNADFLAAMRHLRELDVKANELAVSPRYINLGRVRGTRFAIRAGAMLLDRPIQLIPPRRAGDPALPPDQRVLDWAIPRGVRYYLYQPPISPWRIWHFRLPWLQRRLTGQTPEEIPFTWHLYKIRDGQAVKLPFSPDYEPVRRVPGM